jgi:hypothetical protein
LFVTTDSLPVLAFVHICCCRQGDVEATLDEDVAAEKWAGKKEEPEYVI